MLCVSLVVLAGCNEPTQTSNETKELEMIVGSGLQQITINVPGMT
jgi:hypothetical protein